MLKRSVLERKSAINNVWYHEGNDEIKKMVEEKKDDLVFAEMKKGLRITGN